MSVCCVELTMSVCCVELTASVCCVELTVSVCEFGVLVDSLMYPFVPFTGSNALFLCCSSSIAVDFEK